MAVKILSYLKGRTRLKAFQTKSYSYYFEPRPHGKESTKVRISENKGKESENSYQKLKRSLYDRHTKTHGT